MKLLIASDLHGSYKYTKKIEELILKENPEEIVLLGDLFNSLAEEECINILNKYSDKIIAVRGNCDYIINRKAMFNYENPYLLLTIDGKRYLLTHGHELYKYTNLEYDYILQGHTHYANLHGKTINPGSAGHPRGGNIHTCIIYEDKQFSLINLDTFEIIDKRYIN